MNAEDYDGPVYPVPEPGTIMRHKENGRYYISLGYLIPAGSAKNLNSPYGSWAYKDLETEQVYFRHSWYWNPPSAYRNLCESEKFEVFE